MGNSKSKASPSPSPSFSGPSSFSKPFHPSHVLNIDLDDLSVATLTSSHEPSSSSTATLLPMAASSNGSPSAAAVSTSSAFVYNVNNDTPSIPRFLNIPCDTLVVVKITEELPHLNDDCQWCLREGTLRKGIVIPTEGVQSHVSGEDDIVCASMGYNTTRTKTFFFRTVRPGTAVVSIQLKREDDCFYLARKHNEDEFELLDEEQELEEEADEIEIAETLWTQMLKRREKRRSIFFKDVREEERDAGASTYRKRSSASRRNSSGGGSEGKIGEDVGSACSKFVSGVLGTRFDLAWRPAVPIGHTAETWTQVHAGEIHSFIDSEGFKIVSEHDMDFSSISSPSISSAGIKKGLSRSLPFAIVNSVFSVITAGTCQLDNAADEVIVQAQVPRGDGGGGGGNDVDDDEKYEEIMRKKASRATSLPVSIAGLSSVSSESSVSSDVSSHSSSSSLLFFGSGAGSPSPRPSPSPRSLRSAFSAAELAQLPAHSGWLYKRGEFNSAWKKRFFSLQGGELKYYREKNDEKAAGSIDVFQTQIISTVEMAHRNNAFELTVANSNRVYAIRAINEDEMKAWIHVIKKTLQCCPGMGGKERGCLPNPSSSFFSGESKEGDDDEEKIPAALSLSSSSSAKAAANADADVDKDADPNALDDSQLMAHGRGEKDSNVLNHRCIIIQVV